MSTLRGAAVITGAGGITITSVIITSGGSGAITGADVQSMSHTRDADFKWQKNTSGDDVSAFITDAKKSMTITVLPYSFETLAGAATATDALMAASGAVVTISDSEGTVIDGTFSGKYLLLSAKLNRTNDGFGLVDLEICQWDDNDLTLFPGA